MKPRVPLSPEVPTFLFFRQLSLVLCGVSLKPGHAEILGILKEIKTNYQQSIWDINAMEKLTRFRESLSLFSRFIL